MLNEKWVASTAFYGAIGAVRTFGEVIIDVDKKMTDLKKVMSADTDFDKVFNNATQSAETFGKTISESLDAYVMFAKQGFKGDELQGLANSAIVAGNVGDIEAGKASEYMVASLLQWDKQSSEAMGVVDSWNEISNNFATTVENLAQGQAKAGATARALGMDFDQLNAVVGTLNARTKQSGNEIGNFVKSTFSNIVSNKGRSVLSDLGVGLENEDGSLRDIMEIYKDVAKEYVKLNQADKNSVTLGLAGKYHISRMQTFLDDLGSANSMYDEMYETSKNSENSAMEENQKYLQSLEARINLARVEIEKLSLAIGEAFMTDGMITALQLFGKMMTAITELVSVVGALPVAFLATVTALTLFSNRFKGLIKNVSKAKEIFSTLGDKLSNRNRNNEASPSPSPSPSPRVTDVSGSLDRNTDSTRRNTEAVVNNERRRVTLNRTQQQTTRAYTGQLVPMQTITRATVNDTRVTEANTNAKRINLKAMGSLLAGFGAFGIGAMAVGFGLEFLLSKIGEARQKQEEFKNTQEQVKASFKSNEEAIIELGKKYTELSGKDLSPDSEGYAELLAVQNELATLLPELKTGEDAYGNAILNSSTFVNDRIGLLKDQLELEKELEKVRQAEEDKEVVEQAKGDYSDHKKDYKGQLKDAGGLFSQGTREQALAKAGIEFDGEIKNAKELSSLINEIHEKLNDESFINENNLLNTDIVPLESLRKDLIQVFDEVSMSSLNMKKNLSIVKTSATKNLNEIISTTNGLDKESKETFYDLTKSALAFANSVEQVDALEDVFSGLSMSEEIVNSLKGFNEVSKKVSEDTSINAEDMKSKYSGAFTDIRKSLLETSNLNVNSKQWQNIEKALKNAESSQYAYQVSVAKVAKEQGMSIDEAKAYVDKIAETGDVASDTTGKVYELETAIEKLSGVDNDKIKDTEELIFLYNTLSKMTVLSEEETALLAKTMKSLGDMYPYLSENGEVRVDVINAENEANTALQLAYEASANGILTSQEELTIGQSKESITRLRTLGEEAKALKGLLDAYEKTGSLGKNSSEVLKEQGIEIEWEGHNIPSPQDTVDQVAEHYKAKSTAIEEAIGEINSATESLNDTVENATKREEDHEKSLKETEKAQTLTEQVTDKYRLTLQKLDTEMAKIQSKKSKFVSHSKSYRQALKDENALIQKQIDLARQQAKDLGATLSNGQIINTATTSNTSGGGSSIGKLSGWNHSITSGYGAKESFRKSAHTGVDIDGYMGERLDSNVSGKVIKADSNSISGNYVKIRDNEGYEHFYGHLNKITAKLDQIVQVGDQIGEIGNTGNVVSSTGDGSHLHYEVKKGGAQVDPTAFAKGAMGNVTINVANPSQSKSNGSSNKDKIWNILKDNGFSDQASAGIIGNLMQESTTALNPKHKQSGGGKGRGLAQWSVDERWAMLEKWASDNNKDKWALETQMEYLLMELSGSKGVEGTTASKLSKNGGLNALKNATNVDEATALFEKAFTRAGNPKLDTRKQYANSTYNTLSGTAGTTGGIYGGGASSDAQLEVEALIQKEQELLDQQQANRFAEKISMLDEYAYKKKMREEEISELEAVKDGLLTTSSDWEEAVNSQYKKQKDIRQAVNDELWQTNKFLSSSVLTEDERYKLLDRQAQLETQLREAFNGVKEFYSEVVQGRLDRFDKDRGTYQTELDWEAVKIQSVDPATERYVKTLERANGFRQKLVDNIKEEQKYVDKQLASGEISIEMYKTLTERAKALKEESIEAVLALQQANYEIIQAGLNAPNERIDDHDFNIDRSVAIQNLYEEGSADQLREMNFQLNEHKSKLEEIDSIGKSIKADMKNLDLGHNDLAQLEEQLESNTLAWYATREEIQKTEEAIRDFNKAIDEKVKEKREEIADEFIDALKEAYEEAKEIKLDAIEEEIELEDERHEKVMKQYEDELDMFTKIVDAKRREIEDSDRDRTHGNKLDELGAERKKLEDRMVAISAINTFDAKKERKELQEQIAEVDKQIKEEEYQYSKELQLQSLDDELEDRTEFLDKQTELEEAKHEEEIELLNEKKAYWTKFYDDLLNDERRFHEIRKTLTEGTNEQINILMNELKTEISTHIADLKATLPSLEDTFNGTMEAVGKNIRDSVIFRLEQVIETVRKVNEEISKLEGERKDISNEFGNSQGIRDDDLTFATDKENGLTENDMKVLLAKFAREKITNKLDPVKDKSRIGNIIEKTNSLVNEARSGENGSKISATDSYDSVISTLSQDQMKDVGNYFSSNVGKLGFSTSEYNDYIKDYGQTYSVAKELSKGDKQVLLAKYMKEFSKKETSNQAVKKAIDSTADGIATTGRNNTSLISPSKDYATSIKSLTAKQLNELGSFMKSNSSVISDGFVRSKLEEYAERMIISNASSRPVGLDTGGMTKSWGSSGGVDGKGGKYALLHEREVVLNPVDTQRMLKVSSIMESIMGAISGVIKLPTLSKSKASTNSGANDNSTHIHINIDKMNGTQSDIDNLSKQISNKLLREKGKR